MSRALGEKDNADYELQQALRLLQLEDEDVAMAVALAASLKVGCHAVGLDPVCWLALQQHRSWTW